MPTGTVKYWNDAKGFGFISRDSGDGDIYVHASNCVDELAQGQHVQFNERISKRSGKPEAFDVVVL